MSEMNTGTPPAAAAAVFPSRTLLLAGSLRGPDTVPVFCAVGGTGPILRVVTP